MFDQNADDSTKVCTHTAYTKLAHIEFLNKHKPHRPPICSLAVVAEQAIDQIGKVLISNLINFNGSVINIK